MRFLISDQ